LEKSAVYGCFVLQIVEYSAAAQDGRLRIGQRILEVCAFTALTLLVGQPELHTACKRSSGGCWCGYLSGVRCRFAYGPADASATYCLLFQ